MTLIEKTLKENTDKLLTKIALDYANNLITVPVIFERLEEELPVLLIQALQEQDRESRRAGMKEVLLKVKGNLERFKDKPSLGYTFDVKYNLNSIEDYAKQHNIDLHEN